MALTIHRLLHSPIPLPRSARPRLAIYSQTPNSSAETDDSSTVAASPKKPTSSAQGFGSIPSSAVASKKNQKRKERSPITRRSPVEKPVFVSKENEIRAEELKQNESAFLLTWFGLGGVILIEGIALAASGFLPEEWDKFLVKYLYPVFTPTVLFFLAGTVVYGGLKYIQNENLKDQK